MADALQIKLPTGQIERLLAIASEKIQTIQPAKAKGYVEVTFSCDLQGVWEAAEKMNRPDPYQ